MLRGAGERAVNAGCVLRAATAAIADSPLLGGSVSGSFPSLPPFLPGMEHPLFSDTAGLGPAGLGEAGPGLARQGGARQGEVLPPAEERIGWTTTKRGRAGLGLARRGRARPGAASPGETRRGFFLSQGRTVEKESQR